MLLLLINRLYCSISSVSPPCPVTSNPTVDIQPAHQAVLQTRGTLVDVELCPICNVLLSLVHPIYNALAQWPSNATNSFRVVGSSLEVTTMRGAGCKVQYLVSSWPCLFFEIHGLRYREVVTARGQWTCGCSVLRCSTVENSGRARTP